MGRTIGVALATILLAGCVDWMDPGWVSERGRRDAVSDAAEDFGHNLRWGRVSEASLALEPASRNDFVEVATELRREVRFSDFEVQSIAMGPEKGEASVNVAFQLYPIASSVETGFRERQHWRYNHGVRRWLLTPNLGIYRAQLGSVAPLRR